MGPDVGRLVEPGPKRRRPHVVEEHERPTIRRAICGRIRPTSNPPRSLRFASTTSSIIGLPSSSGEM
jgi:hypothetical protein